MLLSGQKWLILSKELVIKTLSSLINNYIDEQQPSKFSVYFFPGLHVLAAGVWTLVIFMKALFSQPWSRSEGLDVNMGKAWGLSGLRCTPETYSEKAAWIMYVFVHIRENCTHCTFCCFSFNHHTLSGRFLFFICYIYIKDGNLPAGNIAHNISTFILAFSSLSYNWFPSLDHFTVVGKEVSTSPK